ncbi:type II toxin-antitoxin system VapC family toxin [Candidatus Woesearchaeota archaeon]|nr:MAG: type II toxin-antitoxin system VapC family toxin [Candidatus Woesearchaeota archaeon]
MELVSIYYFDSYALIKLLEGADSYDTMQRAEVVTHKLNLMEVCFQLIKKKMPKKDVMLIYEYLKQYSFEEIDDELLFEAMYLRMQNYHKKLSYVDALGYVFAKKNNIKFLTGDNAFQDLPNVQFIK